MSFWATYLDDLNRIDIRKWQREGVIDPGNQFFKFWRNGGGIFVNVDQQLKSVRLDTDRNGVRCQTLPLEWTKCNFGGYQPWFNCPDCRRRAAKLYFRHSRFVCRKCCRLIYRSQG